MPQDDDDSKELIEALRDAAARERGYANYWRWPQNRDVEEAHAADVLARYLREIEKLPIVDVRSRGLGNDPPDCELELEGGQLIGIEISEVVDEKAVRIHAARRKALKNASASRLIAVGSKDANWSRDALVAYIGERLKRKDVHPDRRKGGPYSRYVVALPTDESAVTFEFAQQALAETRYDTQYIDGAFLLLSYLPSSGQEYPDGCPVIRIDIRRVRDE
jgi:hypothetical protein